MENRLLLIQPNSFTLKGGTSKEIPPVDSYKVVGLQQGLLKREK
jgi:hypothetical protein